MASYYPPPPPPTQYAYYEAAAPPPPPGAPLPLPYPHNYQLPPPVPQQLQQQHYLPDQPTLISYAPPVYPQSSSYESVRTLFIAGLPEDVKAREIYNLFREFPGYESSHLRPTASTKPFAFAVFLDQQSAIMALHALNGMVFDLENGSTLFIELAKSNPRSKRLRDDDRYASEKRSRTSSRGPNSAGIGSIHMPEMSYSASSTSGYTPTHSQGYSEAKGTGNKSIAPPCQTLFVANLGQTCSEEELTQVFSRCGGFLKLKIQITYGAPVAFVDFQDINASTEALANLQGTVINSTTTGEGMRLEYAKSRMGLSSKKLSR